MRRVWSVRWAFALALVLPLGALVGERVVAQQDIDKAVLPTLTLPPSMGAKMLAELKAHPAATTLDTKSSPTIPTVWCADITDTETKAVCWRAYRASLDYYSTGLAHRTKVFEWQHLSTIMIFFTVLLLVGAGLYFAWLQFTHDLRARHGAPAAQHTVEMSTTGFKVSSPVLGVIILALSLGFFYLYLVYAYPIHELL